MNSVDTFLSLGYLPKFNAQNLNWINYDSDCFLAPRNKSEQWWVNEGKRLFKQVIADQISNTAQNDRHVLLLSGGLDSRALLGGLLENLPKSQIIIATYGIPSAWDYQIAETITRKYGLEHVKFDLRDESWGIDGLIATGMSLEKPVDIYEAYVHRKIYNYFGKGSVFWSGFMGGNLAGGILQEEPTQEKGKAVHNFLSFNYLKYYKNGKYYNDIYQMILNNFEWMDTNKINICFDMQLDFGLRQKYYIQPLLIDNNFKIMTPFLSREWVSFILKTPWEWLLNERLYTKILIECYPELFNLPTRNSYGLKLTSPKYQMRLYKGLIKITRKIVKINPNVSHPSTNYIDFTESLRHKNKFMRIVRETICDLKDQNIVTGLDFDEIWNEHQNGDRDFSMLLLYLSSLDIFCKSKNFQQEFLPGNLL